MCFTKVVDGLVVTNAKCNENNSQGSWIFSEILFSSEAHNSKIFHPNIHYPQYILKWIIYFLLLLSVSLCEHDENLLLKLIRPITTTFKHYKTVTFQVLFNYETPVQIYQTTLIRSHAWFRIYSVTRRQSNQWLDFDPSTKLVRKT